jgi:hypothetical protein
MSFFEQILSWTIRHAGLLSFGLVWIIITTAAAIWVASLIGQVAIPGRESATRGPIGPLALWRRDGAPRYIRALTLLGLFLASYIAMVLVWEDFAYYDDSIFTLTTLKGHYVIPAIWPEEGRFWPFGLQEFNLIRHFTNTVIGYYVIAIVQLLVVCSILLILDDELNITSRTVLVVVALLTPSILISFNRLNAPERDVLFFLACLVLSVERFERTHSAAWAIAAVVSAQIMMYCKETVFLMVFGFAVSRLILRYRNERLAGRGYRLWARESRLDMCLASLAVVFLILYLGFVGNANMRYAGSYHLPRADAVLAYTRVDFLPWLLVAVLLGRIYMILRHRVAPWLLWDALAAGGVACFLAYIYLGMFRVYYMAPVDLIAVLYVGRFAVLSWKKIPSWGKITAIPLALMISFQGVLVSTFAIFEKKNVIQGKVEISASVETQYRRNSGKQLRLFFPFAGGYAIMEFAAYLNSRGIAVEGADDTAPGLNDVVLAEARRARAANLPGGPAEDGPCVEWRSIWCRVVDGPAPGDLVIVLPDDGASLAEASPYRNEGVLLTYSNPRLPIPQWLQWLFDCLPVGSQSSYRNVALPDRWMDGSVTLWK